MNNPWSVEQLEVRVERVERVRAVRSVETAAMVLELLLDFCA